MCGQRPLASVAGVEKDDEGVVGDGLAALVFSAMASPFQVQPDRLANPPPNPRPSSPARQGGTRRCRRCRDGSPWNHPRR